MTSASEPAWLGRQARARAGHTAYVFEDRRATWSDLAARAERVAAGFAALGVRSGDVVAVRSDAAPDMLAAFHAAQILGAALLPLNSRLAAPEVERILAHACPRLVVDAHGVIGMSGVRVAASFDDVAAAPPKSFAPSPRIDPDAALTIVATSGTSGRPKLVVLTNGNHAASAAASTRRLRHDDCDVWLATIPLFHVGGLAILSRAAIDGSTVAFETRFDAARCAEVLERGDATMISLVPTMLHRVLDVLAAPVSSRVRAVLVGGAPLAPALGRRALEHRVPVSATYGMTEACSQIATTEPASDMAARGVVGRPLDGVEIRISRIASHGANGDVGEILVRGANVARGYFRNPQADRTAFEDGWLATGDLGRIAEDGVLEVVGRRDDMLITGGENVSPSEVEHVLDEHPAVRESLVTSAPDDEWGQRIVALVVASGSARPTADEIVAWCRTRLAAYKLPREVRFVTELPRGATGKLLRRDAASGPGKDS